MPELPEVETVRRGLTKAMLGRRITRAVLHRRDFATNESGNSPRAAELLEGDRVAGLERRGKQIAIVGESDRVIVLHLGMSGQVLTVQRGELAPKTHVHAEWLLDDSMRVLFRDPRRFGGVWSFGSHTGLENRWESLGPDALEAQADHLKLVAGSSARSIKAVLLDQAVLAGVGNIYADEALFLAGILPRRKARRLSADEWHRLADAVRQTLRIAVEARGSTLRDYVGTAGEKGGAQALHRVYGRAGMPCITCGKPLKGVRLAQRATVYCATCQS